MSSEVDLGGRLLTIALNVSPPYVFMESINDTWVLSGGIEARLLESLREHFNFTYRVINCNSDWGVFQKNNTWTGLMGAIVSREADLALAGLSVTYQRARYVFFTKPHIVTSVSFITPPPKNEPKVTLVIEPFDSMVWISIFLSMLLIASTGGLIQRNWIYIKGLNLRWAVISIILNQNLSYRLPNIISLRILMYFWVFVCLVLTTSYGGCLYSLMAVPTGAKPINTLNELAAAQRKGLITVTAIGGSSYYDSLKRSNYGVYREIGRLIKQVKNKKEGLDIVRNSVEPHAYISARGHLQYGLQLFGSKTFHLPPDTEDSTVFLDIMAIAMHKDFEYKNDFNKFISDIIKGGFLEYWRLAEKRKQTVSGDFNGKTGKPTPERLYLDQLQSAFYLYSIGQSLAILAITIEILIIITALSHKQQHTGQSEYYQYAQNRLPSTYWYAGVYSETNKFTK